MEVRVLEVTVGLEPTKTGFAGQRLDHFGIATCENPLNLYPKLYPKLYPDCLRNPYLSLRKLLTLLETGFFVRFCRPLPCHLATAPE